MQRMGNRNGGVTVLDQGDREREGTELEGMTRRGDGERRWQVQRWLIGGGWEEEVTKTDENGKGG